MRQGRKRLRSGKLHIIIDGFGAHVEGAAEDEREAEYIVDLVGVVRAAGRHDHVRAGFLGQLVFDLRVRVGHGADERVVGHGLDHFGGQDIGDRESVEHIAAFHRLGQGALVGVGGKLFLVLVHPFLAALVDDTLAVEHGDVFPLDAPAHGQLGAGDGRSPRARDDQLDLGVLLADDLQNIGQRSGRDNGSAVLVVVEDRDIEHLLELLLDVEAFRCLDVFQVNAAEGRGDGARHVDHLVGVVAVHLDVENVHVGEFLEQDALSFHDGLARQRAPVTQAEDGGTVGDHRHQVALRRELVGGLRVLLDIQHRDGHAGRVGQAQVTLGVHRLGRDD